MYINAGPYLSYTIDDRIKTKGPQGEPDKSTAVSFHQLPNGFKHWEMGLQAGAGYNFVIKKQSWGWICDMGMV